MTSALISNNKPHNLGVLCNISNLENYINTIMRLPMLTYEQEMHLGRLSRDGDAEARHQLVLSHLKLVASISRDYIGYHLPQADLIQEGNMGLLKAAKKFDPDLGARFSSYALQWIKAEMNEYVIRNSRLVKFATTKPQRKLFYNLRSSRTSYKPMTEQEITDLAEKLNVPRRDVVDMEARLHGTEFAIDTPMYNNEGDEYESNEAILATTDSEPSQVLAVNDWRRYLTEGLAGAINALNEREQRVVESRWLNDDDEGPTPLRILAEELGVSTQRVNQIEKAAIKKLQTLMQDYREVEVA